MKAIRKFKSLLSDKNESGSQLGSPRFRGHSRQPSAAMLAEQERRRRNDETARQIVEQRRMRTMSSIMDSFADDGEPARGDLTGNEHNDSATPTSPGGVAALDPSSFPTPTPPSEPRFLGIGTGSRDDFASHNTPAEAVAESPTVVDFDVYDRAFAAEVERIQNKGRKPTVYLTRFLGEKDQFRDRGDLVIQGSGLSSAGTSAPNSPRYVPPLPLAQSRGASGLGGGSEAAAGMLHRRPLAQVVDDAMRAATAQASRTEQ